MCIFVQIDIGYNGGGYSQTLYQRELLRCALEAESNVFQFARFVIITGLDYPLISNLRMLKWYQIHPNEQLMMGANLTKCSPERLVMYQFLRDTKFRNPLYQRIASAVCRRIMKVIPIRRKPYIQLGCQRWDIWQSSAYMSLTHDCAKFVFDMMGKKEVIHFFRYTFAPDEKMIPTIIFNSEYGKNLQKLDKYQSLISVSAMVHFDYGKSIKIYSEGDYEGLIHSEKMFCRKVVTGYSDKLLDLLDKHNGVQTH